MSTKEDFVLEALSEANIPAGSSAVYVSQYHAVMIEEANKKRAQTLHRQQYDNYGATWEREHDATLRALVTAKFSLEAISSKLSRPPGAIVNRMKRLNVEFSRKANVHQGGVSVNYHSLYVRDSAASAAIAQYRAGTISGEALDSWADWLLAHLLKIRGANCKPSVITVTEAMGRPALQTFSGAGAPARLPGSKCDRDEVAIGEKIWQLAETLQASVAERELDVADQRLRTDVAACKVHRIRWVGRNLDRLEAILCPSASSAARIAAVKDSRSSQCSAIPKSSKAAKPAGVANESATKSALDLASDRCKICSSGISLEDNPIVFCDGPCHGTYHVNCYGIPWEAVRSDDPWYCAACTSVAQTVCPGLKDQEGIASAIAGCDWQQVVFSAARSGHPLRCVLCCDRSLDGLRRRHRIRLVWPKKRQLSGDQGRQNQ